MFLFAPRPPLIPELVYEPEPGEEDEERPDPLFVPDPSLATWVNDHFLNAESPLLNTDHGHLAEASIGYVWTNVRYLDKGRPVLGEAKLGKPTGKAWSAGPAEQQRREWFDAVPDFYITLYAPWAAKADAAALLAVIDHELYHCGVKQKDGEDVVNEWTGVPVWEMRGHDVEQFIGVVERYGAKASMVERLVWAARQEPLIARADIDGICGSCLKR